MPIPVIPNRFALRTTVPGTNTNSNYTIPQARQSYTYRPRNMGDIAAERAVRNRQQRTAYDRVNGQGTYNAQQSNKDTQVDILKSKQEDTLAQMAGGAANGIDATMGILSMVPGSNLAGDTYFALKGAKDLNQGNYLGAALNTVPIGASVLGRGLDMATPYIRTGLDNLSNMFGIGLDRASQLYKPLRDYRVSKLFGEPKLTPEFTTAPDNSFSYKYPYSNERFGYYFKTTNPHTNVVTGFIPLNEKSTAFFQSDVPNSYYNEMATQIRNKNWEDSAKLGLHKSEWVDKMNNDDLLDFVNGGTQNIKDTPINSSLWNKTVNYFNSSDYADKINRTANKYRYNPFIKEYLPYMFNHNSFTNVSERLMEKYDPYSGAFHFSLPGTNGANGANVFRNFANATPDYGIPTYFHEVGGHGTEKYFGFNRTTDPTGVSQASISKIGSSPAAENIINKGLGQDYYVRPNEMRARAISTNAFINQYPKRAKELFKIDDLGNIGQTIGGSEPDQLLTGSFNTDWPAFDDYLHNAYKKGGKI